MPRATPCGPQPAGELVGALGQLGEGVAASRAVGLDDPQRGPVGVLGGQHGVEPVEGEVEVLRPRPAESGSRRRRSRCGGPAGSHGRRGGRRRAHSADLTRPAERLSRVTTSRRSRQRAQEPATRPRRRSPRPAQRVVSAGAPRRPAGRAPGGGIPNGSRSPCTTSTRQRGAVQLARAGLRSGCPGGCSGKASATTPRRRPTAVAVRQATRAPLERPASTTRASPRTRAARPQRRSSHAGPAPAGVPGLRAPGHAGTAG